MTMLMSDCCDVFAYKIIYKTVAVVGIKEMGADQVLCIIVRVFCEWKL